MPYFLTHVIHYVPVCNGTTAVFSLSSKTNVFCNNADKQKENKCIVTLERRKYLNLC